MNTSTEYFLDTKQKKLAFLQNTIVVAKADNFIDETEGDFIFDLAQNLDLSQEDTNEIVENLSDLSFIIPEDNNQKQLELQTLVMMMWQDGRLEEKEYDLCLQYAKQVGYSKETLDYFIDKLRKE